MGSDPNHAPGGAEGYLSSIKTEPFEPLLPLVTPSQPLSLRSRLTPPPGVALSPAPTLVTPTPEPIDAGGTSRPTDTNGWLEHQRTEVDPDPTPPPDDEGPPRAPGVAATSALDLSPPLSAELSDLPPISAEPSGEADIFPMPYEARRPRPAPQLSRSTHEAQQTRFPDRRWPWIVAAAALVVIGAVTLLVLRGQRERTRRVIAALDATAMDREEIYLEARRNLAQLESDAAEVAGALGLIDAHLWLRFSNGDRDHVLALLRHGEEAPSARLARALFQIYGGHLEKAEQNLAAVEPSILGWHRRFVDVRLAIAQGDMHRAGQLLEQELQRSDPAPAVLLAGAQAHRLAADTQGRELIDAGLLIAPDHPGLLLERALRRANRHPPDAEALKQARRIAGRVPRYRARRVLLEGYAAAATGEAKLAVAAAEEALALDPSDPHAAWLAAVWQLAPGGDARLAATEIGEEVDRIRRIYPAAPLSQARAALLLGRPGQAQTILEGVEFKQLRQADRARHHALSVWAATETEQPTRVAQLCKTASKEPIAVKSACAEAMIDRADLDAASPLIRSIRKGPESAYLRGLWALTRGESRLAVKLLTDATRGPTPSARSLLAMARALAMTNQPEQAVSMLRRALIVDARSIRSRVALARSLVAAGHDTEALTQVEQVLESRPTAPRWLAAVGHVFLALGQPEKISEILRGIPGDLLGTVPLRLLAGRAALADGKLDLAESHFTAVLDNDPRSAGALLALGRIHVGKGQALKARAYFSRALRLRPRDPELLRELAHAYAELGRWAQSMKYGQLAVKYFRDTGQSGMAIETMIAVGAALGKGDRRARRQADKLLRAACRAPQSPALAFVEHGRLQQTRGQTRAAIRSYREALRRDAELPAAHLSLGLLLRGKARTRKEGRNHLRQYLKLNPDGKRAGEIRLLLKRR